MSEFREFLEEAKQNTISGIVASIGIEKAVDAIEKANIKDLSIDNASKMISSDVGIAAILSYACYIFLKSETINIKSLIDEMKDEGGKGDLSADLVGFNFKADAVWDVEGGKFGDGPKNIDTENTIQSLLMKKYKLNTKQYYGKFKNGSRGLDGEIGDLQIKFDTSSNRGKDYSVDVYYTAKAFNKLYPNGSGKDPIIVSFNIVEDDEAIKDIFSIVEKSKTLKEVLKKAAKYKPTSSKADNTSDRRY